MKLGTAADGSRDGCLHVADTVVGLAAPVPDIATTLQSALDRWRETAPALREAAARLRRRELPRAQPVDALPWRAPLPRAYQLLDGGGYMPHLELGYVRRKQPVPPEISMAPLFYQSTSDSLLGPGDDICLAGENLGVDFEAELAVVVDDVPQGTTLENAPAHILLVGLMNDVSLRIPQREEFARGFGFFQCKPKKAFAPFFVTPDELAPHWRGHVLALPVRVQWNGRRFGEPNAGEDHLFDFGSLVAQASLHRDLASGTIVAGGTVSNRDRGRGHCCIHERRVLDLIETGEERTPFMRPGDRVRIEVLLPDGGTVFGAIDQTYRKLP